MAYNTREGGALAGARVGNRWRLGKRGGVTSNRVKRAVLSWRERPSGALGSTDVHRGSPLRAARVCETQLAPAFQGTNSQLKKQRSTVDPRGIEPLSHDPQSRALPLDQGPKTSLAIKPRRVRSPDRQGIQTLTRLPFVRALQQGTAWDASLTLR